MPTYETRILKNGTKRYKATIRLQDYPTKSKTFRLLDQAQKWAIQKEADIISGKLYPSETITFNEIKDRYLTETLRQNPIKDEINYIRILKWWSARIGHLKLSHLTPKRISEAKQEILNNGRTGSTVNHYLAVLSSVLRQASGEWGLMPYNPVQSVKWCKQNKGRTRYLDINEKDNLLIESAKSQNTELYHLIDFALVTCARQSEILGLTWKDIDLDRRVVYFINTKNERPRNTVIPDRLIDYFKIRKQLGKTPFTSPFPRKAWENIIAKAKIKDFTFHDLRHTGISYIAMNGASDSELMAVGGWKNRSMIDRYTHLRPNFIESVITTKNPFF